MESNIPAEYPSKPWQLLFDYLSGLCEIPPTLSEMEDLINVVEKMIGHKALQARCDRYEKVFGFIKTEAGNPDKCTDDHAATTLWNIINFCNEALNGEGKEGDKQ